MYKSGRYTMVKRFYLKSSRGMRGTEEEANVSLISYLTNRLIYLKDISFHQMV